MGRPVRLAVAAAAAGLGLRTPARAQPAPCDTSGSYERCGLQVDEGVLRERVVRGVYRERVCGPLRGCALGPLVRRSPSAATFAASARESWRRSTAYGVGAGAAFAVGGLAAVPLLLGGGHARGGAAVLLVAGPLTGLVLGTTARTLDARARGDALDAIAAYNAELTRPGAAGAVVAASSGPTPDARPVAAAAGACDTSASRALCELAFRRGLWRGRVERGAARAVVAEQQADGAYDLGRLLDRSPEAASLADRQRRQARLGTLLLGAGAAVYVGGASAHRGAAVAAVGLAGGGVVLSIAAVRTLHRALTAYNAQLTRP